MTYRECKNIINKLRANNNKRINRLKSTSYTNELMSCYFKDEAFSEILEAFDKHHVSKLLKLTEK